MNVFSLIADGLAILFEFDTLMLLFAGVVIGIVGGSIPGLSSSNLAAILLPLTLGMTTHGALVFLGSMYVTCQYGGSIPAILFKTPGTTGAGATTLDGFPLARQGRATFALGISLTASCVGGVFVSVVALFIMKPSAQLALKFGPAEIFLLALFGIVIIVAASGKDLAKGLLAGVIGLLIATMPADPIMGRPRLTFGLFELFDSIPLVPALIGMFAYPSLISLVGDKTVSQKGGENIGNLKEILEGARFTFRNYGCLARSSVIGLLVGIVPGAGIDVASFLSYGQAKVWSKDPDSFGKGNPEGVLAPETANSGVASGALVPSIALGIPGSATTAIMLAALTLHGINPGPQVLRTYPAEVYAVFLSILFANILLWPLGFLFNKCVSKLSIINTAYLIPAIFCICLVGTLTTRNFILDMYLFLIFGLVGYLLVENRFPLVPLILGIVMGTIAEENFIVAFRLSRGSFGIFFNTLICWILWVTIVAALVVPQVAAYWREKKRREEAK